MDLSNVIEKRWIEKKKIFFSDRYGNVDNFVVVNVFLELGRENVIWLLVCDVNLKVILK